VVLTAPAAEIPVVQGPAGIGSFLEFG